MSRILTLATLLLSACSPTDAGAPSAPAADPRGAPTPPAPEPPPVPIPAAHPGRLVALGDLHGDLRQTVAALVLAGLLDAKGHWSGGTTILVQTGDVVDRGGDSRAVLDLLQRIEAEAPQSGGNAILLLGNHERMNTTGDLRYVTPDDVADFGDADARAQAFAPNGPYGAWLRTHDAIARVGDTVFVHGGIRERFARLGIEALNDTIRRELFSRTPADGPSGDEGPLWYRGYVREDESVACAELDRALKHLGARRMVVGHTTQKSGKILSRCEGRLHAIDVGLSTAYGGDLAAWESTAGDARAIYPSGAEDLPDPR